MPELDKTGIAVVMAIEKCRTRSFWGRDNSEQVSQALFALEAFVQEVKALVLEQQAIHRLISATKEEASASKR